MMREFCTTNTQKLVHIHNPAIVLWDGFLRGAVLSWFVRPPPQGKAQVEM